LSLVPGSALGLRSNAHCAIHDPVFTAERTYRPTADGTATATIEDFAELTGIDTELTLVTVARQHNEQASALPTPHLLLRSGNAH
jgi:hypothetical protein